MTFLSVRNLLIELCIISAKLFYILIPQTVKFLLLFKRRKIDLKYLLCIMWFVLSHQWWVNKFHFHSIHLIKFCLSKTLKYLNFFFMNTNLKLLLKTTIGNMLLHTNIYGLSIQHYRPWSRKKNIFITEKY